MRSFLFLLTAVICLMAYGQKKLLKQATALESSGQFEMAAEKYQEVLYKNMTQAEAMGGLKRTSQKVADKKLSDFFIAKNSEEHEEAIRLFEEVLYYQKELDYFNVSLDIPSYYFDDYESEKKGLKTKKDNKEEEQIASYYKKAIKLFENENWVQAWRLFDKTTGYKETSSYQDQIKEKASRITIVANSKNQFSNEEKFRNTLLTAIIKQNNPLIKVINRDNLEQLIEEQKLGLSGLLDEQSVASLGKILGVEMMLLTRVLNHEYLLGNKTSQNKTAYTASIRQAADPITQQSNAIKDYHPVIYQEHQQQNSYNVSFQYQLINVSTAEILAADIMYESYESKVYYATYDGDPSSLFPTDGSSIYMKGKELEDFLTLFTNKSQPISKKAMEVEVQQVLAEKVSISLNNYFNK